MKNNAIVLFFEYSLCKYTKEYVSKIDQNIFKMEDITEEVVICTTIRAACNVPETEREKNARKRRKRVVWVKVASQERKRSELTDCESFRKFLRMNSETSDYTRVRPVLTVYVQFTQFCAAEFWRLLLITWLFILMLGANLGLC